MRPASSRILCCGPQPGWVEVQVEGPCVILTRAMLHSRWEVEVQVEGPCVILTRAMLHSRWEVEVQVEVPCVIIENVARAMLWPTMWVSAGDSAL